MQIQCPWCGKCGPRFDEREYVDRGGCYVHRKTGEPAPRPHDDGSSCVCRHPTAANRAAARRIGGRYWNGERFVCMGGCEKGRGLR